ncbi:hypothetical protein EIP91_007658 [Steccherinum ochraceum]|uniref:N-terminal nucleophile aminohydrolase n=1 Tax=Steccherinum ochraceum TaxID=92696 RepID=A0A4R0R427_9APHY|nr:hypothetical protein EIP91_007658 [Steccherinum ochraceum]
MPAPSITSEKTPLLGRLKSSRKPNYVLVIHGGAGTMSKDRITPEQRANYKAALSKALLAGHAVLSDGGEAMDAAVAAVTAMEDCPLFNSGKGAVFNVAGKNELETSIMLSKPPVSHQNIPVSRRGFGLTLLKHVRNPSQLARALYLAPSAAPHTMLSGIAAEELGKDLGIELVDESYFWTENRWREHRRGLGLPEEPLPRSDNNGAESTLPLDQLPKGTVGAVALDVRGCIAAVTSTGGRTNKLVGRIGDTPSMGSGFWAEEWEAHGWWRRALKTLGMKSKKVAVGVSGTGDGDYFIRLATASTIGRRMKYRHESVQQATTRCIEELRRDGGDGGVIAVDNKGRVATPLNCAGMYRGVIRTDGVAKTAIFADDLKPESAHCAQRIPHPLYPSSMSANKYAGLPDIDTAPDVYETEDVFPSSIENRGDSSEDESGAPTRQPKAKNVDVPSKEELDTSSLMPPDEANKKFRKAEKRRHRPRIQYTYPPSPTSSGRSSPIPHTPALPLSQRLRTLQAELAALETELADPSNPLLHKEREEGHVDPGELIRGMVDVKGRLDKISKLKEGRGKLVSTVLGEEGGAGADSGEKSEEVKAEQGDQKAEAARKDEESKSETRDIAQMDQRLGELEKIIGSSSTTLDEMSPLPPPLLPLLTRLNTQLTLLTQPRHIDSISRRLKLLLSDLDRVSAANNPSHGGKSRQSSHHPPAPNSPHPGTPASAPTATVPSPLQEQLTPILTRLAPLLPHIPHILTRLRTLSSLHTSAASFQTTLEGLEEEQKRGRAALEELLRAVEGVENSLKENEDVVKKNVADLEERIEDVGRRMEDLKVVQE